ncbi:MAG TPA: hypothetical protein VG796_14625 [Verrucomicrobiales bacterium]|nr:hypothetical protein [Verrucomicrobiales bacterium]
MKALFFFTFPAVLFTACHSPVMITREPAKATDPPDRTSSLSAEYSRMETPPVETARENVKAHPAISKRRDYQEKEKDFLAAICARLGKYWFGKAESVVWHGRTICGEGVSRFKTSSSGPAPAEQIEINGPFIVFVEDMALVGSSKKSRCVLRRNGTWEAEDMELYTAPAKWFETTP